MQLICVLKCDEGYTHATVVMSETITGEIQFHVVAHKLSPGLKGFHVHQTGDLRKGCESLGSHYNPTDVQHGGRNESYAHRGDMGNIHVDRNGDCDMMIYSQYLTLEEMLGRSLVIHSNRDDLGRGNNKESLRTGNSGTRICCGVIGLLGGVSPPPTTRPFG